MSIDHRFFMLEPTDTDFAITFSADRWASLDFEVDLRSQNVFGPSPSLILQALTLTSAADGVNLGGFLVLCFKLYAIITIMCFNFVHISLIVSKQQFDGFSSFGAFQSAWRRWATRF